MYENYIAYFKSIDEFDIFRKSIYYDKALDSFDFDKIDLDEYYTRGGGTSRLDGGLNRFF